MRRNLLTHMSSHCNLLKHVCRGLWRWQHLLLDLLKNVRLHIHVHHNPVRRRWPDRRNLRLPVLLTDVSTSLGRIEPRGMCVAKTEFVEPVTQVNDDVALATNLGRREKKASAGLHSDSAKQCGVCRTTKLWTWPLSARDPSVDHKRWRRLYA